MKTPPESDQWFQSYEQLKDSQNYRKQNKFILLSGYKNVDIRQLTINTLDFRLIPPNRNTCDLIMYTKVAGELAYIMFILLRQVCYTVSLWK